MIIKLDMTSNIPIYVQLRNEIVMGIGRGELKKGEGLPTVRQMAEDIGVNNMTVNKAYGILKSEGYIEIDRRHGAKVSTEIDMNKEFKEKLEGELEDAVTKIENFKDFETEKSNLTKEIEELKKAATEKDFNSALESALKEAKVKNSKLVKALLDNEKLTLKDGKLEGIEEQLKTIKEENDFLFEKVVKGIPDFSTGGKGSGSEPTEKSLGEKLAAAKSQSVEIKY